MILCKPSFV